jgi:hypothetical protein
MPMVLFFILMSLSIFIVSGNFLLIIQNELHGLGQTAIPLVGGLVGMLALIICPGAPGGLWLLPFLIDPGSAGPTGIFLYGLWKKKFGKTAG